MLEHKCLFIAMHRSLPKGTSAHGAWLYAKERLGAIFQPNLAYSTVTKWPAQVEAAKEKAAKAKEKKPKGAPNKKHHAAPSVTEKEVEVTEIFVHDQSFRAKLPASLLVQMAVAVYAQILASIPLTCVLILPILLAVIDAHGYRSRLHSQQPDYPADSLCDLGLTKEKKKLFLSKRW